jgi:hypothetical protein
MVIRGGVRGNGAQLGRYLTERADNDNISVFDIRGTSQPDDLKMSLLEMSLTSELTMSDKGLYHAQINPAYGDDKKMKPEDWIKAADILEDELKLNDQKRVIVLHEKKSRTHAHIVWERYDHTKGIMISDSFSRLAQDRARKTMEKELLQQPTPHRNTKRPEMKAVLTELWQKTATGAEFIKGSVQKGYQIAKGELRRPFMVVDETGRSFDLVRQLTGVKIKEVRERLKKEELKSEKEVIAAIRSSQQEPQPKQGEWVAKYEHKQQEAIKEHYETARERAIRELREQLERQRQLAKQRDMSR